MGNVEEQIDHKHPLFLQPSDTPGSMLIPIQLTGTENYGLWSRSMKIALLGKGKLGFVNGNYRREKFSETQSDAWEKCDAIVHSWIMNSVSKNLLNGIVYGSSANAVWEDLEERFNKINRVRVFQLHREITNLAQGTHSVSVYYSKLKELWDEYNTMISTPKCDCPKSKEYADHLQEQRLLQFLNGLNDSYDQTRRQILMKTVAPTVSQAYAMISEDESERKISCSQVATAHDRFNDPTIMQASRDQMYRGKKPIPKCEYCHVRGHCKEQCWKLIGYPDDYKPKGRLNGNHQTRGQYHTTQPQFFANGKNGGQSFANVNNVCGVGATSAPPDGTTSHDNSGSKHMADVQGQYFTESQYQQILSMLNKDANEGQQAVNSSGSI
ncbi:uncharacterized protein [Solanum tuberosum]|uniref:uncharacterized protein n=1 Tax=Solanum tuberosum TaxID=4113 RepID=UPI00073A46C2|nr:PREDICTED: uncharacterized protein LOC107060943 [Solanum tuberosum]